MTAAVSRRGGAITRVSLSSRTSASLPASSAGRRIWNDVRVPLTRRLADGTTGYLVRFPRTDDCFAAALATCLQVPIERVPDPCIDERLRAGDKPDDIDRDAKAELARWLTRRGLRMIVHTTVPANRCRWIGVVALEGLFVSHSMVMSFDEVLFDPTLDFGPVRLWSACHVTYGISFNRRGV